MNDCANHLLVLHQEALEKHAEAITKTFELLEGIYTNLRNINERLVVLESLVELEYTSPTIH